MKFKYLSLLCLVSLSFLLTGFFGSSPEKTVSNAKLQGSKETLGELLEKYKYAINPKWSVQKAKDGTEYVEFKAAYDTRGLITSLYEKQKLPAALLDYISKLPPQVFIVGKFLTDDGKITNSVIQLTDKTDVIHAPMSLPMGIFTQQTPIPETFILDDWAKYYKYQVIKFLFSHNYGSKISFYTLCPNQSTGKFPVRIDLNKIEYDDAKMEMKVSGDLSLLDYRLTFTVKNGDGGSKYSVNGKPMEDQKAFQELMTYASNLGEMFPELANASIVQTIPIEGTAELGSRWPGINLNTKVTERISFDITSFEPFSCKWRLMDDVQDLFSPETKKFLSRWEKIQSNWVRRKAQSVPEFGKGTQVLHYVKGSDTGSSGSSALSVYEGMSADDAAAIAAGKSPVKLRPTTYDLNIFYNESIPEDMRFTFTVNDNSTIEGTCEPNGGWIKCRYTPQDSNKQLEFEVPNEDSFELRSITFISSPHEYIRMQFKDIATIPTEESAQKVSLPVSQTSTGNGKEQLSENRLIPGRYIGKDKNMEMIINLHLDGTGNYTDDGFPISWTVKSDNIEVRYPNEEEDKDIIENGKILSNTSFVMKENDIKFVLEADTKPQSYSYSKNGFTGSLLIQPPLDSYDENRLCIEITTINNSTSKGCHFFAWCDKEARDLDFLECGTYLPDRDKTINFLLKFPNDLEALIDEISEPNAICEPSSDFSGGYKKNN